MNNIISQKQKSPVGKISRTSSAAFLMAAILFGISACGTKEGTPEGPVEVTFNANITAQTEVRSIGNTWEVGDEIGVFMISTGAGLSDAALVDYAFNRNFLTAGNEFFAPVNVSHKLIFPANGSKVDFIAYHPYTSDSNIKSYAIPVSVANQNAEALYLLYSNTAKSVGKNSDAVSITFNHMLSKLVFPITLTGVTLAEDEEVTITVKGMNVAANFSLVDGKFTYTGNAADITPISPASKLEYEAVILPTVGTPAARSIKVSVPGVGDYTLDIPASKAFDSGKIYEYPVEINAHGITVVDGEIVDWTGKNDDVEEGEANPPVRIPEKEWMDQPNTYIATPGTKVQIPVGKAYAMWYHDSELGTLQENLTGKMTAELVWEEVKGLVPAANITITGKGMDAVINVQSDPDAGGVATDVKGEGNAVIALKFGDNIYWTWQIWYTAYNPELAAGQKTNNGVTLMDRNLGAWDGTYGSTEIGRTVGTYYQWGRKDPLRISNNPMGGLTGVYLKDGTKLTPGAYHTAMEAKAVDNLVFSIRNPLNIIKNASGTDWLFNSTTALSKSDRWRKIDGSKGAYDPCPAGWQVPTSGAGTASLWNGIVAGTFSSKTMAFDNFGAYAAGGYYVGSTGFAASGAIGNQGYIWTAGMGETPGMMYCLKFTSSGVTSDHLLSASSVMPVRCAKIK